MRYRFKTKTIETLIAEGWHFEGSDLVHPTLDQRIKNSMISHLGQVTYSDKPPVDGKIAFGIDESFPLLNILPPDRRAAAIEAMSQVYTQEMCEPFAPPPTIVSEFTPTGFPLSVKLLSNGIAEIGNTEIPRSGLNQLAMRLSEFLKNTPDTSIPEGDELTDDTSTGGKVFDFSRSSGGTA